MINRVLIVGLGSIGKRHLRLARMLLPEAEIQVLRHKECDEIPEYANGCLTCIDDALLFSPDIALIANPATQHLDVAIRLAHIGTHLMVEKPLAASTDRVEELVYVCRQRNAILITAYNLRFTLPLQNFRKSLYEGLIGRVLSVRAEVGQYLPSWRPNSDYRSSVSARKELGGGALLELSHEIDYLRWIFGEFEWVQAIVRRQSSLDIDVEDTAYLTIGFVPSTNGHQLVATLNLDFIRHDTKRLCTAIGEDGSLRWNGLTGTVQLYVPGAAGWKEIFCHQHQQDESYLAEWQHFLACVGGQESPLVSGSDGLAVLKIIDAVHQSSASGCMIEVRGVYSI